MLIKCYNFDLDPGSPEFVQVAEVEESSIRTNWKPPRNINGVLEGYLLLYSPPHSCVKNGGSSTPVDEVQTVSFC